MPPRSTSPLSGSEPRAANEPAEEADLDLEPDEDDGDDGENGDAGDEAAGESEET
jgi:hypothetical protein